MSGKIVIEISHESLGYAFALFVFFVYLIKIFLYDDRPLPAAHQVSKEFYQTPRRFILTGSASGVSRHFVGVLLKDGHKVIATDVNFEELVKNSNTEPVWRENKKNLILKKLDVRSVQDWKDVIKEAETKLGGVDVLMNIAGLVLPNKIQNVTEKEVDLHVDVNLKGVIHGISLVGAFMKKQVESNLLNHGGHIINFASLGAIAPVSGVTLYIATKAGCRLLSLCSSKDLFDSGVYCTVVMPDAIQTPMVDLQLNYEDSAWAFSGGILTVQDVEKVVFDEILPNRPRERSIPTNFIRGKGARLNDIQGGSRLISFVEERMKQKGIEQQKVVRENNKEGKSEKKGRRKSKEAS